MTTSAKIRILILIVLCGILTWTMGYQAGLGGCPLKDCEIIYEGDSNGQ